VANISLSSRWRNCGLGTSLAVHGLLVWVLLIQRPGVPHGLPGPDIGTGFKVVLVSGTAAGSPDAGEIAQLIPEADRDQARLRLETSDAASATAPVSEVADSQIPQEQTQEKKATSLEAGEAGLSGGAANGAAGATDSVGGDPLATDDLLSQVARCLPPDYRPVLSFSQLTLTIGPDGRLRAAPEVNSTLPRLTAEDRLAADRIVQAALQCGPYVRPNVLGRVISLAADFSSIQPGVVGVGLQHAQAGSGGTNR
jgi:hypothetical protein